MKEYLVWQTQTGVIEWFTLKHGQYERLPLGPDGAYRSEVFPGLWLDAAALTRGDLARVLQLLQQGLASPEHSAFVAQLQQRKHT